MAPMSSLWAGFTLFKFCCDIQHGRNSSCNVYHLSQLVAVGNVLNPQKETQVPPGGHGIFDMYLQEKYLSN